MKLTGWSSEPATALLTCYQPIPFVQDRRLGKLAFREVITVKVIHQSSGKPIKGKKVAVGISGLLSGGVTHGQTTGKYMLMAQRDMRVIFLAEL